MSDRRDCVVVIGCGLMGGGIAARSALAGNRTTMVDTDSQKAALGVQNAYQCIDELYANGLAVKDDVIAAKERLSGTADLQAALEKGRLVIEAVYENLELKQELFKQLDELLPASVLIVSNTSGLRITDIAAKVRHPQRTMTAHFWFPAHLVPLVEVVMGDETSEELAISLRDELKGWGKAPVLVKKDLPGQLANRLLQAVIREAVNIVEMGLASPEDVDTAVKMGMGIRFPVWGPLEHIDAVGLDLASSVQNTVLPELSGGTAAAGLLNTLVAEGTLGYKSGQGIYDWSVKDMEALAKKRNQFIMEALKLI